MKRSTRQYKMCEIKLSELFRYKYVRKSNCLIQFFSAEEPAEILGKLSSFSASYQLFLVLLNGHWVFCKDPKQTRNTMRSPQSSGTAIYWTCLRQQGRYWKSHWWVFIRKSSFKVLFSTDFYTKQRDWFILNVIKKIN